ncbi:UNVERIFIED_CONTAM: hypothetical protein Sindi_2883700 [Sesamum indicum]
MEILDKCYNGLKTIDPKLLMTEEEREWLINFEVRQVLLENSMRRLHSTEVHGRIPAKRSGMDLHKNLTDLKSEIADLKTNQRENFETSKFRQEQIRDALGTIPLLHQKGKVIRADISNLQELAESFFQLGIVDLVSIQTNKITPALPPPEESTCSNDPPQDDPMRESADFHTNATPTFVGTRLKENSGKNPKRVPENTP